MQYYLVITNKLGDYEIVNGFSSLAGFELLKENTLEGITTFTSSFIDREHLTLFLRENHLLPLNEENKERFKDFDYHILSKRNKTTKILEFGIPYATHSYLFEPRHLVNFYQRHLFDMRFMRLFNQKFSYLSSIPKFKRSLTFLFENVFVSAGKKELNEQGKNAITYFIKSYIMKDNKKGNALEINYLNLLRLAMFASEYENSYDIKDAEAKHYANLIANKEANEEEEKTYLQRIREINLKGWKKWIYHKSKFLMKRIKD